MTYLELMMSFQSTPPHGERRYHRLADSHHFRISIHAPAWGATSTFHLNIRINDISIHAPAWGATYNAYHHAHHVRISIHAPAWGATAGCRGASGQETISIHAPAWGATVLRPVLLRNTVLHFNPRPRMGSDSKNMRFLLCFCNFH